MCIHLITFKHKHVLLVICSMVCLSLLHICQFPSGFGIITMLWMMFTYYVFYPFSDTMFFTNQRVHLSHVYKCTCFRHISIMAVCFTWRIWRKTICTVFKQNNWTEINLSFALFKLLCFYYVHCSFSLQPNFLCKHRELIVSFNPPVLVLFKFVC